LTHGVTTRSFILFARPVAHHEVLHELVIINWNFTGVDGAAVDAVCEAYWKDHKGWKGFLKDVPSVQPAS